MKALFGFVSLLLSTATFADQIFLEGFPDVPLIEGVEEIPADRVIFDAPSGTVAETALRSARSGAQILDAYAKELPAFGWNCTRQSESMKCVREENILVFSSKKAASDTGIIMLRLVPAG